MRTLFAALAISLLLPASFASAEEPTIEELLDGVNDANRGVSSHGKMTMHVKTKRWERTMSMEMWSRGEDHSLVKILSPAKEAGTATLRVEDNIWNYLPKVDRTMKVPASMMSGAWMGSHFTNNDLVQSSRFADDYTWELTEKPAEDGTGQWVIECTPNEDAPVVWGKVIVTVRAIDRVPSSITYWDEDGTLVRTMSFEDIQDVGGKPTAMKMLLTPADEPDEYTEFIYNELQMDVEIPDSTFTLQALKN